LQEALSRAVCPLSLPLFPPLSLAPKVLTPLLSALLLYQSAMPCTHHVLQLLAWPSTTQV